MLRKEDSLNGSVHNRLPIVRKCEVCGKAYGLTKQYKNWIVCPKCSARLDKPKDAEV